LQRRIRFARQKKDCPEAATLYPSKNETDGFILRKKPAIKRDSRFNVFLLLGQEVKGGAYHNHSDYSQPHVEIDAAELRRFAGIADP
jgi:hypothetical protein